jgi:hypothetical protein
MVRLVVQQVMIDPTTPFPSQLRVLYRTQSASARLAWDHLCISHHPPMFCICILISLVPRLCETCFYAPTNLKMTGLSATRHARERIGRLQSAHENGLKKYANRNTKFDRVRGGEFRNRGHVRICGSNLRARACIEWHLCMREYGRRV